MSELRPPTQREIIGALAYTSDCLRHAASLLALPSQIRARLMRCAVRGERVLLRLPSPRPRKPRS